MKFPASHETVKWLKSTVLKPNLLRPTVATLFLTSVLIGGVQLLSQNTDVAARSPSANPKHPLGIGQSAPNSNRLPPQVQTAVLKAYSQLMNIPVGKLKIISFSQETWTDTCLGLGRPEESCGAILVEGWRVEVGDTSSRQFYRTDNTGSSIRHEDVNHLGSMPQGVSQKVLEYAAKDLGVPARELKVADGRSQVWDGCLGVAGPEGMCTMIGIPGWQAIVTGRQQYAVYHLNQSATLIKRNSTTSSKGEIVPSFWQPDPGIGSLLANTGGIVFQSVTSGGIAGQTYRTLLRQNGQVVRIDLRSQSPTASTVIRKISPQKVQQFVRLLQQNEFGDFLDFNYPSSKGADYLTIALLTPDGLRGTQYADIVQDQTPPKLQRITQAWNCLTNPQLNINQCKF